MTTEKLAWAAKYEGMTAASTHTSAAGAAAQTSIHEEEGEWLLVMTKR